MNEPSLLKIFVPTFLLVVIGGAQTDKHWKNTVRPLLSTDTLLSFSLNGLFRDNNSRIKGAFRSAIRGGLHPADAKPKGHATYIPTAVIEKTKALRPGRAVLNNLALIEALDQENNGKTVRQTLNPPSWFPEVASALSNDENNPAIISLFEMGDWDTTASCRPLADRWMEILGSPLVPFSASKRKTLQDRAALKIDNLLQVRREASVQNAKKKREASRMKLSTRLKRPKADR